MAGAGLQAHAYCPYIAQAFWLTKKVSDTFLAFREVYGKPFACDLLDLSGPMLARAKERVLHAGVETAEVWQLISGMQRCHEKATT